MVNDLRLYNPHIGDVANIKKVRTKKEGNNECEKPKKGTVYFNIFHQNIRGLGQKAGELLTHLHPDFPHIMCLTEHHLKYLQLEMFRTENYNLGAHYCRQQCEKGGVAIFVHNSLDFTNIDIAQHCKLRENSFYSLDEYFELHS